MHVDTAVRLVHSRHESIFSIWFVEAPTFSDQQQTLSTMSKLKYVSIYAIVLI